MSAQTLAESGLDMTEDGWTYEVLDVDTAVHTHNEVGGDMQVSSCAPSVRFRFVSRHGEVMVWTTNAYITAFVTSADVERVTGEGGQVDYMTTESVRHDWREHLDALADSDDPLDHQRYDLERDVDPIEYGYDVVSTIDYWAPGNTDDDAPDYEDSIRETELDSLSTWRTMREAERHATDFIRAVANGGAHYYPSNFDFTVKGE